MDLWRSETIAFQLKKVKFLVCLDQMELENLQPST